MEANELQNYQDFCERLLNNNLGERKLQYLLTKFAVESGELAGELCGKFYHNPPKKDANQEIILEAGDVLWYFTNILTHFGLKLEHYLDTDFDTVNSYFEEDIRDLTYHFVIKSGHIAETFRAITPNRIPYIDYLFYDFIGIFVAILNKNEFTIEEAINGNIQKLIKRHGGTVFNSENFANNR